MDEPRQSVCPRCCFLVDREPRRVGGYIISGTDFCPRCGYEFESEDVI